MDSIGYSKVFKDYKTLNGAVNELHLKLNRIGYIDAIKSDISKINDSLFSVWFDLGIPVQNIKINLNNQLPLEVLKSLGIETDIDSISLKIQDLETKLNTMNSKLSSLGDPFSSVQLINLKKNSFNIMSADLIVQNNKKRKIDRIVIKGYEKFPESYLKRHLKIKTGQYFNLEDLNQKTKDLETIGFANQLKDPEVLFTKDSTILYLYLNKVSNNNFDGFLGFGTNENTNRLELDGYLNLELINNLNFGEELRLAYKSDEIDQQTFDVKLKMPYLLQSPLGVELGLNIFRKDSSFVTSSQIAKVGFQIDANQSVGIGISNINSSNLLENNTTILQDYKSSFYLLSYYYRIPQFSDPLFPINFSIDFNIGAGNRTSNSIETEQTSFKIESSKILNLNHRNSIYLRITGAGLFSDNYFDNELFRFGGNNSIRGFEENSITASLFSVLNTEYRYRISNTLFINSVIDAAYVENQLNSSKEKLFGFGFGFGLLTQAGLFRFNYASGKNESQPFTFSNSKVHISLIATF